MFMLIGLYQFGGKILSMVAKPKPIKQKKKRGGKTHSERSTLDTECMEYIKMIVRLRDGGCVTLGASCGGYLTASHWQKRGKQYTRYDLRNINCQCSNCNGRHNNYTSYYDAFMLKKYGYDICLELSERASMSWKWSIVQLREIRDGLKAELERLQNRSLYVEKPI
jgi:hypothetical protein